MIPKKEVCLSEYTNIEKSILEAPLTMGSQNDAEVLNLQKRYYS